MVDKIPVSEKDLASFVEDCLTTFRWKWVHFRPARVVRRGKEIYETPYAGHKGFLDYLCLRPPRVVVIELKSEAGKLSSEQQGWFDLWEQCQKPLLLEPLKLKEGKASVTLKAGQKILTIPEVYCWRPSDFERITEILR